MRFLSCEPLLEHVDLTAWLAPESLGASSIDWIIIGGESGHKARPFDLSWARSLVSQARSAGAAPFVKQLGAVPISTFAPGCDEFLDLRDAAGGDMAEWPEDLRVREFPKP